MKTEFDSNHLNGIGRHPNVNLAKPEFETLFEILKELKALWQVWNVNKYAS